MRQVTSGKRRLKVSRFAISLLRTEQAIDQPSTIFSLLHRWGELRAGIEGVSGKVQNSGA
jgi:hypothetical protein